MRQDFKTVGKNNKSPYAYGCVYSTVQSAAMLLCHVCAEAGGREEPLLYGTRAARKIAGGMWMQIGWHWG